MKKIFILASFLIVISATIVVFSLSKKNSDSPESFAPQAAYSYADEGGSAQYRPVRIIDESDHVLGSSGELDIIIYCDFECPFCLEFQETFVQLKEEFGDKITVAFRHFPLSGHQNAVAAAEASECAGEQGKFWEMHDKLFEDNAGYNLIRREFLNDARELALDAVEFDKCLSEGHYRDKIYLQMGEARLFGVSGTPTIFVGDIILPGAYPMDDFVDSTGVNREGLRRFIEKQIDQD